MSLSTVIREYLDDKISLGRGAEELRVPCARLERFFERLGVPKKPASGSDHHDTGDGVSLRGR